MECVAQSVGRKEESRPRPPEVSRPAFFFLPVADKKCPNLSPLLRVNEISHQVRYARRVAHLMAGSLIPQMGVHRGGGRG